MRQIRAAQNVVPYPLSPLGGETSHSASDSLLPPAEAKPGPERGAKDPASGGQEGGVNNGVVAVVVVVAAAAAVYAPVHCVRHHLPSADADLEAVEAGAHVHEGVLQGGEEAKLNENKRFDLKIYVKSMLGGVEI